MKNTTKSIGTNAACIMLIEDDKTTNFINQVFLYTAPDPVNVRAFESADDALDFLLKGLIIEEEKPCNYPDLILLDLNLPGMSGWDFITELKKIPKPYIKHIKIIILSNSHEEEDRKRAMETGLIDDYIFKPLSPEIINQILKTYLT